MDGRQNIIKLVLNSFSRGKSYYYSSSYKNRFNNYYSDQAYLELNNNYFQNNCTSTNDEISFNETLKFGSSLKDVKKKLSSGSYYLYRNKDLNTSILLFRMFVGNHKVKCQMHFFNNNLFFFNFISAEANNNSINELITTLQEKYTFEINIHNVTEVIENSKNCEKKENYVDLTIHYLSLCCNYFLEKFISADYKIISITI